MSSAGRPSDYFKMLLCSLSYGHSTISHEYEHERTQSCYTHAKQNKTRRQIRAGIKPIDAHAEDPSL